MTPETFKSLLAGYRLGTLSPEEQQQIQVLLHDPAYREQLENLFTEDLSSPDFPVNAGKETLDMVFEQVKLQTQEAKVITFRPVRWVAAAVAVLAIGIGGYYLGSMPKPHGNVISSVGEKGENILPGRNKAVLTLSDGSKISLDDMANGEIAKESGVKITKTADGRILYSVREGLSHVKPAFNTISTPNGGQYQIALPDGTMVWLNAASSLKYPSSFTGKDRFVTLTGEAYFEVAKDKKKPFRVKTLQQEVEVLGTHFNINAYGDEEVVKTTLIEGSVKVKLPSDKSAVLKPGEQSSVLNDIKINQVDANSAIDWKQGLFWFNDESIYSIMRQFSRWYNIEVEYRGNVSNIRFGGQVSRMKNLSQVLRIMELTKSIQFKVEGNKIIVMPYAMSTQNQTN
ncbi:FecR family protein [Pedobacter sp. N36a]|uniref:FecR family protein n=1 Tax=Pedobacter sp. N36a TaxID=2767996 RepID=UPI001656ACDA|nr:FecR family protein [Pedobacter sp. N36a]MBC8985160.1 FecR family protein [Pedobacter sp. N36a]